jgi:hypothetical protein
LFFGYAIPQYAQLLLIFSLFLLAGAGYFVKQPVGLKISDNTHAKRGIGKLAAELR